MKSKMFVLIALSMVAVPSITFSADAKRQADVAEKGSVVMPFDLKATTHIFTKTSDGGIQQVVVKHRKDKAQITFIRSHLKEIQGQFLNGDFAGPSTIHGDVMPGLDDLKRAKPGAISIDYMEIAGGAELVYKTADANLVMALHHWFDAQLADHGTDAKPGHSMHHMDMNMKM